MRRSRLEPTQVRPAVIGHGCSPTRCTRTPSGPATSRTCDRSSTTRSASSSSRGVVVTTASVLQPAARADSRPLGASSTTRHRAGSTPSRSAASRYGIGGGLAALDLVGGDEHVRGGQAGGVEPHPGQPDRAGGGDRGPTGRQRGERLDRARQRDHALGVAQLDLVDPGRGGRHPGRLDQRGDDRGRRHAVEARAAAAARPARPRPSATRSGSRRRWSRPGCRPGRTGRRRRGCRTGRRERRRDARRSPAEPTRGAAGPGRDPAWCPTADRRPGARPRRARSGWWRRTSRTAGSTWC